MGENAPHVNLQAASALAPTASVQVPPRLVPAQGFVAPQQSGSNPLLVALQQQDPQHHPQHHYFPTGPAVYGPPVGNAPPQYPANAPAQYPAHAPAYLNYAPYGRLPSFGRPQ